MPRKQPDVFYIYKTTCTVTGRYYIGMHATANIDDGYLGSGKRLRNSIRKHGKENHVREILEFLPTKEQLIEREKEIITSEMLCDEQCMNIMSGGTGGYISVELQKYRSQCANAALQRKRKADPEFDRLLREKMSQGSKQTFKNGRPASKHFFNKKHSKETIERMKLERKGKGVGKENSQFGTCWVNRNGEIKKVSLELLNLLINEGWSRGRKI